MLLLSSCYGSSTTRDFYFLRQYVTTWRFERIMKQFISARFVVYLCDAMGVASICRSADPDFEYHQDFYFN